MGSCVKFASSVSATRGDDDTAAADEACGVAFSFSVPDTPCAVSIDIGVVIAAVVDEDDDSNTRSDNQQVAVAAVPSLMVGLDALVVACCLLISGCVMLLVAIGLCSL